MLRDKTIIYTGNFSVENMNAAGKRVFANALIMQKLGYHMVLVGVDSNDKESIDINTTYSEIEGIEIYHYPGILFQNHRANYHLFFNQLINLFQDKQWNIKVIIGYNSPSTAPFIGEVIKFCHMQSIKYITDVADWLIVDSDRRIFKILRQFDITLKNAYYSNKSDGVIAISTWLADYYKKRVKNVIVVPPIAIKKNDTISGRDDDVQVVYAGIPFREGSIMKKPYAMKDRFDITCEMLLSVKRKGAKFKFHVYGFSKDQILFSVPFLSETINELGDAIVFYGRQSMETVQVAVADADYTILLRDTNRMSMAGFSTKVSESVTCGTPIITTRTSDIDKYLVDGDEVLFVDINDIQSSTKQIVEAFKYDKETRAEQKQKCLLNTAFDANTYINRVGNFLQEVIE